MTSAQRAGALATALVVSVVSIAASPRTEYRIDGKRSRLSVETETVGLSSMFGHDHRFDARDFGGSVSGGLELRQSDFKIKPFTFAGGTVKVRDHVALTFNVVATR